MNQLELNTIYCGDCLEVMQDIADHSVDCILCDLPYGTTRAAWDVIIPFDALWEQYKRVIKENGVIILTGTEPFSSRLRLSNLDWYKYDWIWNKIAPVGFLNAKKQPLRVTENISIFYQHQPVFHPQMTHGHERKQSKQRKPLSCELYNRGGIAIEYNSTDRYPLNIQAFSMDKQKSHLHPTQKPVELFKYLIRTYTNPGAVVLDNCIGSGTTAIAALETARRFIGIELQEKYVDIANARIAQYFQELSAERAQ